MSRYVETYTQAIQIGVFSEVIVRVIVRVIVVGYGDGNVVDRPLCMQIPTSSVCLPKMTGAYRTETKVAWKRRT